jgi:hypothetical protein
MAEEPSSQVEHMLSTADNPWNPWTNYDEWYQFDQSMGYNTPGFLARIANTSLDLSEPLQSQAIEDAINEIVQQNVLGIYESVPNPAVPVS